MNIPKSFIKTKFFEIGRTVIHRPNNKKVKIEFYKKRMSWWLTVYGVRFNSVGYYIMVKKCCI